MNEGKLKRKERKEEKAKERNQCKRKKERQKQENERSVSCYGYSRRFLSASRVKYLEGVSLSAQ